MGVKQKSRPCPHCKSKKTERIGEFGVCLECQEPFHHSKHETVDLESGFNESLGGTDNGDGSR